jgi:hypothetical protein
VTDLAVVIGASGFIGRAIVTAISLDYRGDGGGCGCRLTVTLEDGVGRLVQGAL